MTSSSRLILHVDIDAFFAQVEVLTAPRLRGRPLVVGGIPGQRGVVACASYEARPFGIHAGMSLAQAMRRCPHAVFLPCHRTLYLDCSVRILKLLLTTTPLVEMGSIDEAYLDLSGTRHRDRTTLANSIQQLIQDKLHLSSSIGIGPNKLIAKMASGIRKPGGVACLDPISFGGRFGPEPVTSLYGVGAATGRVLASGGISTIEQLARTSRETLRHLLGNWGPVLGAAARGEDQSPVIPHHETPTPKSIGHEYTLPFDSGDQSFLGHVLVGLCEEVAIDLRTEGKRARTICLKIRTGDFEVRQRQSSLRSATYSTRRLIRVSSALFERMLDTRLVRRLGITVTDLEDINEPTPRDLFDDRDDAGLDTAFDSVRDQFGNSVIRRASLLSLPRRLRR